MQTIKVLESILNIIAMRYYTLYLAMVSYKPAYQFFQCSFQEMYSTTVLPFQDYEAK